ncbi:hypothetical protein GCM10025867_48820 (plasmid) [Frondihabitans sucicola]|uniref:Uncharacterized protein n=1 Tax=Frondihabitans sucicola TaxID=1268041 RepID=A0ABM8GW08_9MICO|nr:hypothetical protein [Frondihabitans sucicola]BDZ52641.1 hypothetical protein GCM10025867_48820 [Frondihabitans sucicola]
MTTNLNVGGGTGILTMPVPPLLSKDKPLPESCRIEVGDISLSFIMESGLRLGVRNRQLQASAGYAVEMNSGPLAVQVVPIGEEHWTQEDFVAVDAWVRALHGDASRLLLESFVQFEDAILARERGATLTVPLGWDAMEMKVSRQNPYRGHRTVIAVAVSEYINRHSSRC